MKWTLLFSSWAQKDAVLLAKAGLKPAAEVQLALLETNPFAMGTKALVGDLKGFYSRRINIQHRLVFQIDKRTRTLKVLRMWSHYGD